MSGFVGRWVRASGPHATVVAGINQGFVRLEDRGKEGGPKR